MKKHFKYLSYVLKHKWYVFYAGIKIGAPIHRLIIHDWSKFLPSEWYGYVEMFYGESYTELEKKAEKYWMFLEETREEFNNNRRDGFNKAWLLHQKRNKHHWQYWLLVNDKNKNGFKLQAPDVNYGPYFLIDEKDVQLKVLHSYDSTLYKPDEYLKLQHALDILVEKANFFPLALEMPDKYILEMVADWAGAGKAITGKWEVKDWYYKNKYNIILNDKTRIRVENLIEQVSPLLS